jgi:translin
MSESIESIISRATEELNIREKARDEVLSRARQARMLSKQSIMLVHNLEYDKAITNLERAKKLFEEMEPYYDENPELEFYGDVGAAQEEYSEAVIFYYLRTDDRYPTPEEINIPSPQYLLGLGDIPGEFRREALDALRKGNMDEAEAYLDKMEEIYLHLVSMEEASLLLKGLRRKLDIARRVIENTRGDLTAEAGRRRLNKSVNDLLRKLNKY